MRGEVNCVSYVRYNLGLDKQEEFVFPPSLPELFEDFEEVPKKIAQAIGVIGFSEQVPKVLHLGILEPNNKTITHRPDVDTGVTSDPLRKVLSYYSERFPDASFLYLAPKSKPIK